MRTLLVLHCLASIWCYKIKISVLYEKEVVKTIGEMYKLVLNEFSDKYNHLFKETNIKMEIENVLSFNQYENDPRFEALSVYAGGNDVQGRLDAMSKLNVDGHILLAASTNLDNDDSNPMHKNRCKILSVINLNSWHNNESELFTNIIKGIVEIMSEVLGTEVPNVFESASSEAIARFREIIKRPDVDKKLNECEEGKNKKQTEEKEISEDIIEIWKKLLEKKKEKVETKEVKENPEKTEKKAEDKEPAKSLEEKEKITTENKDVANIAKLRLVEKKEVKEVKEEPIKEADKEDDTKKDQDKSSSEFDTKQTLKEVLKTLGHLSEIINEQNFISKRSELPPKPVAFIDSRVYKRPPGRFLKKYGGYQTETTKDLKIKENSKNENNKEDKENEPLSYGMAVRRKKFY